MKILKLFLLLIVSGISYVNASDESVVITEPRYPGTNLAMTVFKSENEDGICRTQGYTRSVRGSYELGPVTPKTLFIDKEGNIEILAANGERRITEIVCLNKTNPIRISELILFTNPTHPSSQIPLGYFNGEENLDGLCKFLGHNRILRGSMIPSELPVKRVILLDKAGQVSMMANKAKKIDSVICFK